MKYRINSTKSYTKKMKTQVFLRWFFYALVMLFFYCLMSCGAFNTWQPYMIICLATAVSMHEQEFSSSVFGIFSGFLLDISAGTLFGFHAALLMPCCMFISLLSRNLTKANFINHVIMNAVVSLLIFGMRYIFEYVIWKTPNSSVVLLKIFIPSFAATVVMAIPVYFLVRLISRKFRPGAGKDFGDTADELHEDEN